MNSLWLVIGSLAAFAAAYRYYGAFLAAIALTVGTTYMINYAPKRIYALCTGIPFVFVLITVQAAGVQSVLGWWRKIPTLPAAEAFPLKLCSILASIMLALTVVIAVDAGRRWFELLRRPRSGEPVVANALTETV